MRYFRTSRKEKFISFNTIISILGIALGVAALIGVLGVMTGFGEELREKIIGANPHISLFQDYEINNYEEIEEGLERIPGVVASAPFIRSEAVLYKEKNVNGVLVKGIDLSKELRVTKINEYLRGGIEELNEDEIILGSQLARKMFINQGETIILVSPVKGKKFPLTVKGFFESGMYDYDSHFAFINLEQSKEIFNKEGIDAIGIKVDDAYQTKEIKRQIYNTLGFSFILRDWQDLNKNFLAALALEKWVLFVVVTLVVLVAAFNIISTLVVFVKDKTKDIGILKAIGATNASIAAIFRLHGLIIGFLGTLFGLALGFGACYLMRTYIRLPAEVYYLEDSFPVLIRWQDLFVICSVTILITFFAALYPSIIAARLNPVDALRYE